MCWRESFTVWASQKHYSGTRCNTILHYSYISFPVLYSCSYNSPAVFITPLKFPLFSVQTQLALCHYSTSLDEEGFADASDFCPERWIRKDSTDRVDNFGSIPFGYGIRSCIGRRIAELEMHLALTRVGYESTLGHTHSKCVLRLVYEYMDYVFITVSCIQLFPTLHDSIKVYSMSQRLYTKMDNECPILLPSRNKAKKSLIQMLPSCGTLVWSAAFGNWTILTFLFGSMSHLLTWRRKGLWPIQQLATRGQSRCFVFIFGSRHVI